MAIKRLKQPRKDIHLVRARQAQPFVEYLNSINAPVTSIAKSSGLDLNAVREGEQTIPEKPIWKFLELASRKLKLPTLGYQVAVQNQIDTKGMLAGFQLPPSPSLLTLLERFIESFQSENTGSDYTLSPSNAGLWIRRRPIFTGKEASWQMEQYFLECFFQIIRTCTGPGWLPSTIRVSSRKTPATLPEPWRNLDVKWGYKLTEILIPSECLPMKVEPGIMQANTSTDTNLPSSMELSKLLQHLLESDTATVDGAAHYLGMSSATLKRRLKDRGTSFSLELERCRYDLACRYLEEDTLSLAEISQKLRYGHQGNFSRKFKALSGLAPREYRKTRNQVLAS